MVVFHLPFLAELFGKVGFSGEGRTGKNYSPQQRREPTTNSTHTWRRGQDLNRVTWWEARALTTAPSLVLKTSYSKTMAKHWIYASDFVLVLYVLRVEHNVINRDSEPTRLLETPRSLSVYNTLILRFLNHRIINTLTLKGSPSSTTQLNFCSGTLRLSGSYTDKLPITVPTGLFSRTCNIKEDLVT